MIRARVPSARIPGRLGRTAREAGGIAPTAWTGGEGEAVATYQTQGPEPRDVGPAPFYDCGSNHCLYPCYPERSTESIWTGFSGPNHVYNPRDGVNTILAAVVGEESFDDVDGNGVYDSGESYVDLSEPYIDSNDNEIYDPAEDYTDGTDEDGALWSTPGPYNKLNNRYDPPTPWIDENMNDDWDPGEVCLGPLEHPTNAAADCYPNPTPDPGCVCFPGEEFDDWNNDGKWNDAEFFVDYDEDGQFDYPNGQWDSEFMIWRSIDTLLTGNGAVTELNKLDLTNDSSGCTLCTVSGGSWGDDCYFAEAITIPNGGSNTYLYDISDMNFNPLDDIAVTYTCKNCTVYGNRESDDPTGQAWTHFFFTVMDSDVTKTEIQSCEVEIKATWKDGCGGNYTLSTKIGGICR